MNPQSLLGEPFFELAHGARRNHVRDDLKKRRLRNEPGNLPEVLGFVGRHSHGAIRGKSAMDRREEIIRYQTARRMTAFRPGIGKHEMKRRDGILWEVIDDVGDFESQDARVRQPSALDSSTSRAHSTDKSLDAEKISIWILAGKRRKKRAVPAAEIDFDRGAATENPFEVERRKTIGRDDFYRAC